MKKLRAGLALYIIFTAALAASASSARLFTESNSHINKMIQDHAGYIWMATDNGLTRFDGSTSKTFTRSNNSPSLLNNMVLSVMEDSKHDLWVGTYDGIQIFDRSTETFVTPRLNYPGVPEFTYVNSIIEDSRGDIWFTTSRSGAICFQGAERKPVCFLTTNSAISSDKTTVVFEDRFGNIWIGTNDAGITVYNPSNNTMTHHRHDAADPASLSGNMIFSIAQANDGRLLIASLDGGIDSYDYRTHRFTRSVIPTPGHAYVLQNDPDRNVLYIGTDGNGIMEYDFDAEELRPIEPAVTEFDITRSKIHDIFKAADANLWAAVYQKGALRIPPASGQTSEFENLGFNPFRPERSIGTEPVLAVMKDADGDLWIGTDGDGIYRGRRKADALPEFSHIGVDKNLSGSVLCIFQDRRGSIWAGSYLEGLSRFDAAAACFRPVRLRDASGLELDIKQVNTIAEDAAGNLWIGTNGSGVCVLDATTGLCRLLRHDPGAPPSTVICGNAVHAICFDHNGDAWIGTSDAGLSRIHSTDGRVEHFNLANRRLASNCVYGILEDATGRLWVGTSGGLACISSGGISQFFNEASGLPGTVVYGILADSSDKLWLSTLDGVVRFDPDTRTFSSIGTRRLRCREFKRGAAFADSRGRLWFGGVGGVVGIDPDKAIGSSTGSPAVRFTELEYSSTASAATTVVPLYDLPSLTLGHTTGNLTARFGAIEYVHADEVEYSVMLRGFHDTWQAVPAGVYSYSMSDIPPGRYTLCVKALADGASKPSMCEFGIEILPPFWLSRWAKLIYVLASLALIAGIGLRARAVIHRRRRLRLKAREESLMEDKLQFFTDISHEIRTPLSLVLGPIAALKKNARDKATLRTYEMMENNGKRILRMIAQVIDLRKLDNKRMQLEVAPTDIRSFLALLCESFSEAMAEKEIGADLTVADDVPERVWVDADKLDKVTFNVLANAVRFTPRGGKVGISADIDGNGSLRIRVSDTGEGIPAELRELIFERFYQIKGQERSGGTGIGLHLSRKMMQAHHGSVFVESSGAEGSVFAIILPCTAEAYSESERADASRAEAVMAEMQAETVPVPARQQPQQTPAPKAHTVLVIEDDSAILDYLTACLGSDYNIATATDGEQGLEAALRLRPHCIVSDIMMPGIDGLELCRKIRDNHEICDIPVVMLTARADDSQRMEGIEAGADSYITKPFSIDHLRTQIAMLIHSRRVIRQKFSGTEQVNEEVVSLKSGDEKLLERVEAAVLGELANPDLSVEFIASHIGVSRSHLHRRLKVLTNMSPSAYIKKARMRHAARLLTEKNLAVSEVAYATGFSSLSHFSTVFKEYYGMSPTRYVAINGTQLQK
ncbi:MAG: response regulator [Muribaculaceae bacterium]|nr:response regulator [Muribaculaceae bacterium]